MEKRYRKVCRKILLLMKREIKESESEEKKDVGLTAMRDLITKYERIDPQTACYFFTDIILGI